jgi:hypothetical protein
MALVEIAQRIKQLLMNRANKRDTDRWLRIRLSWLFEKSVRKTDQVEVASCPSMSRKGSTPDLPVMGNKSGHSYRRMQA